MADTARAKEWARAIGKVMAHDELPAILARADAQPPEQPSILAQFISLMNDHLQWVHGAVRKHRGEIDALDERLARLEGERTGARRIILPGDGR